MSAIEQITNALANQKDIQAIHILSHGAPGILYLGNTQLSLDTLSLYANQLQQWRLTASQILLYGCSVAAGDAGAEFIEKLHQLTGAAISANPNPTGNAAKGGTWSLTYQYPGDSSFPDSLTPFSTQALATYSGLLGYKPLKDINPGANSSNPQNLTNVNGTLYFNASDPTNGTELWKSDGTAAGTVLVKDINPGTNSSFPSNLTNVNGTLYFIANDPTNGNELWKSDGTAAGTVLVKDINPGTNSSFPNNLTNVNGTLYFIANDPTNGTELWKSDGTAAGTVLVKDINPGAIGSSPQNLTNVNGTLYFNASDTNGAELWKSDGTAAGTVLVKDINPGASSSNPSNLTNVNGTLYFRANDPTNGAELWKSDGTAAGTVLVKDIDPGAVSSFLSNLTNVNGTLYFRASDTNGTELWKSDGTAADTVLVKDINPGANGSSPSNLTNVNGTLYFNANIPTNGAELWKSDGTAAGTVLVKDINPGAIGSSPQNLTNVNGTLYFNAIDPTNGAELWKSDGTAAGTVLVKDINPGTNGSAPQNLTNVNGNLYFNANNGINGTELWGLSPAIITQVSSTTADGLYKIGQDISITVKFDEPVTVTGNPQLQLKTGTTNQFATYLSSSTTDTLTFKYTVQTGDESSDLEYLATNSLTGGTIKDSEGLDANLTLPALGVAASLGGSKALVIDGIAPTVTINQGSSQADPTANTLINYTVEFSEPVTGFDQTKVTLSGTAGATATEVTGGGKSYNVAVSGMTKAGTVIASINANAVTDVAGNPNTAASTSTDNQVTFTKNTAPVVASAINNQSATLNTAFTYTVPTTTFTDADNDTLTYTATKEDGTALPTWLTFNATTRIFSGTPATANIGNLQVKVSASDGKAATSNTFLLTVSDKPNTAPVVASAINNQSATLNTAFTYTVPTTTFTDAENDPLTYTATKEDGTALPSWLTFNATTRIFSGTPATANIGNLQVKVSASDGKAATSNTFLLTVSDKPNTAPVVASAINNQSATLNTAFTYTVPTTTFTDAENDPLTYTATKEDGTALPSWLTFNATTRIFSGTPATANIGNLQVKVSASDGTTATSNTFLLTVSDKLNTAPVVASAINNQSATLNTAFNYTVPTTTFTDAENDPLTYTATKEDGTALPTWLTFNATTRIFNGTPATANIGNLQVKVSASDGTTATSNTFLLTVSDKPNTAPVVASAINNQSATLNTAFNYTVPTTTFTDAENDPLTYTA
ncbi:ELWxxDGT repeat protein, partial [Microcoleus sp.]|uniref:ELWxxDGT repeat protein n=1 Tax=Microcoleus sp. TaxID=44472 RepID=UPI003525AEF9